MVYLLEFRIVMFATQFATFLYIMLYLRTYIFYLVRIS
jgi:hypothetical protein